MLTVPLTGKNWTWGSLVVWDKASLLLTFWRALWGPINLVTLHLIFEFLKSDENFCSSM